jgi:hypothetical protein
MPRCRRKTERHARLGSTAATRTAGPGRPRPARPYQRPDPHPPISRRDRSQRPAMAAAATHRTSTRAARIERSSARADLTEFI